MKPWSSCFSKHKVLSSNYHPNKKERKKETLRVKRRSEGGEESRHTENVEKNMGRS
jgi:hypothetical protein